MNRGGNAVCVPRARPRTLLVYHSVLRLLIPHLAISAFDFVFNQFARLTWHTHIGPNKLFVDALILGMPCAFITHSNCGGIPVMK